MWLSTDNLDGSENLIKEIEKKGIDKNRLFFAKFEKKTEDHLARIKLADLCLDTYPYGSHTTCYDYLVAGVPIITLKGNSFASKVSASILESMNLQELITHSFVDYEKKIIDLITSPEKLLELKKKLEINKTRSNLFNINSYKENLEKSYEIIYTNKLKGLPISNITIN